jgi:hypothetical protein
MDAGVGYQRWPLCYFEYVHHRRSKVQEVATFPKRAEVLPRHCEVPAMEAWHAHDAHPVDVMPDAQLRKAGVFRWQASLDKHRPVRELVE